MKNLFSDDNSGYRLKTLQILNWGVFDEKVKTFEFDNKSTLPAFVGITYHQRA